MDIASLLEVQVNEGQSPAADEEVGDCKKSIELQKASQLISSEEGLFFRRMFGDGIAQVRFRRLHCTACDAHIGSAPSETYNMQEHPILKTLLCASCREFYGDGNFEQGDDATDMFCRWCANGGNLYCCSYCSNTFCNKCIKRNFDAEEQKKIEDDEKWKCFVCDPTDLFALRATCRALQQHVKTLAKILKADRSMTPKEIDQKMEQDDTKCCVGRRSRRRRRESSSGEEYSSERSRSPSQRRNRSKKCRKPMLVSRPSSNETEKTRITLNGTSRFIPIAPRYVLQEMVPSTTKIGTEDDDIPPPLLQCEQTMIEGENETVTPQGVILPANSSSNSNIPESILYNSAISLNPIPSQNIIRGPLTRGGKTIVPVRSLRRIDALPRGTTPQQIHRLPALPGRLHAPMVSIPTRGALMNPHRNTSTPRLQLPNYLRCKSNLTVEPSVIDLESDSEELVIVEPTRPLNRSKSPEQTTNKSSEQPTKDLSTQTDEGVQTSPVRSRRRIFEANVNNPLSAIDDLLEKLREKLKLDLDRIESVPEDNDVHNAHVKLKIINRNVDRVVSELAAFNNSMVQQYRPWKKSHGKNEEDDPRPIVLKKNERSSKFGTLDLECVRDSEPDVDDFDDDDAEVEYLLDFSKKLTKFVEKDTVNQGTLARVETEDKAIQAYETMLTMDYDKSIGYSLLMKADYDYTRKKEVYKPAVIHDEYFGKYEEQFIFYLQNFEDHRKDIDVDAENEKASLEITSLTELIDADIAQKTDENPLEEICDARLDDNDLNKQAEICQNGEVDSKDSETAMQIDEEHDKEIIDPLEKPEEASEATSEDTSDEEDSEAKLTRSQEAKHKETVNAVTALIEDDEESEPKLTPSQEAKHEETVIAVRALIEEESNDVDKWKNTEDEDECTILD